MLFLLFSNLLVKDTFILLFEFICVIILIIIFLIQASVSKLTFEYYILVLLALLGTFLIMCSNDFLVLYLALELQSLVFYVLAVLFKAATASARSGDKVLCFRCSCFYLFIVWYFFFCILRWVQRIFLFCQVF